MNNIKIPDSGTEPDADKKTDEDSAYFVGIRYADNKNSREIEIHLDELESLAASLGITSAGRTTVTLKKNTPAFLTGSGKAEEITNEAHSLGAGMIIFDDELSPSQQRNWEQLGNIRTIDRQEVILNIFEQRASTKEAFLQVELATYKYLLPRLKRAWTHLSRQRGGVSGTKGEGEKQIEIDRRNALDRITKLNKELDLIRKKRGTMRKMRSEKGVFTCAIAGYTNSGKSTLLKALTGADTEANDRLFDTLDPSTRRLKLKGGRVIVLTDTVGFIRKLPHQLVEAFKSTLEETLLADLIILLLDASSPEVLGHFKVSNEVLEEIGAQDNQKLIVFNKIDRCKDSHEIEFLKRQYPDAVFISAAECTNLSALTAKIEESVSASAGSRIMSLYIPAGDFNVIQIIKKNGFILSEKYTDNGVCISASVPQKYIKKLDQYSISNPEYIPL